MPCHMYASVNREPDLVVFIGWSGLQIASGYVNLLSVIVEIHAGHLPCDGSHYARLASMLTLLVWGADEQRESEEGGRGVVSGRERGEWEEGRGVSEWEGESEHN